MLQSAEPEASDQPGTVLGEKYELVSQVGSGGMATVWAGLARGANGFRKPVAVKRILRQYRGYPEIVEMFVEEARVGVALRHPNIVEIYDFGADERGHHFLVSELVRGIDVGRLSHSFGRGSTPWPLVAAIAVEVLRALEAAHARHDERGQPAPILHRDVTPSNILLDEAGLVKLADFGLARAMDRTRRTRPDIVKGKLSYLAPELLWGHESSVASDLFSLGVVLWEVLAGERLFDAETDVAVVNLVREAHVPLLSAKRPDLPLGVVRTVHQALEKQPERRFGSAREMLLEFTRQLRVLPNTSDSSVLAQNVSEARRRLTSD
ncbi:serine/threonine-protein kinase [Myxococcota bacterium]